MPDGALLEHDWFPRPLPDNVVIGERSWVYSAFAFRHYRSGRPCGVSIGHDTGIYNGTFFDLGPDGEVEIGAFCTSVGAIFSTNARVVVEDYAFLAHEVLVADSPWAAPGRSQAPEGVDEGTAPRTAVHIGRNAWIGARAILLDGAVIGENAIVGAAAVVDWEVPANAVVAGNPARVVGWVPKR